MLSTDGPVPEWREGGAACEARVRARRSPDSNALDGYSRRQHCVRVERNKIPKISNFKDLAWLRNPPPLFSPPGWSA